MKIGLNTDMWLNKVENFDVDGSNTTALDLLKKVNRDPSFRAFRFVKIPGEGQKLQEIEVDRFNAGKSLVDLGFCDNSKYTIIPI